MRKSCIAAAIAVTFVGPVLLATPASAAGRTYTGIVVGVNDGDSIVVDLNNGPDQIVRLVGVDADEEYQCYYDEAKEYAESELLGERVRLRTDRENDQTDETRLFAYVYVRNELFNYQTIAEGHSRERSYGPDYELRSEFEEAEEEARRDELGLWSDDDCT